MSVAQTGQLMDPPQIGFAELEAHTALSASPLATRYLPKSKPTHIPRPTEINP